MVKKTGLGKGLDALFGDVKIEEQIQENDILRNLKITEVEPNEILERFEIVKIDTDERDIDAMSMMIHLDERMNAQYQENE